jgi:hypothetical protein
MATEKANEKEATCVAALMKQFPPSVLDKEDEAFLSGNTYLRFARARDGNVDKASVMLKAAIAWRKETKPYALTSADVKKPMEQVTMVCGGRDKEGFPVIAMVLGMKNDCTVEERTLQIIYILEETQRKGYDRLTWIIDFGAMGKQRDERSKETRKKTMKILQDYYPERMANILMYRPPWYVSWLLGLAKAFMDPRTAAKVHKAGSTIEDLEKHVDRSQVPKICGGTLEGSNASVLDNLPPLTEWQSPKKATGSGSPAAAPAGKEKMGEVESSDKKIAVAAS